MRPVGQCCTYQLPVSTSNRLPSTSSSTSEKCTSGSSVVTKSKFSTAYEAPFGVNRCRAILRVLCWAEKRLPCISDGNALPRYNCNPLIPVAGNRVSGGNTALNCG